MSPKLSLSVLIIFLIVSPNYGQFLKRNDAKISDPKTNLIEMDKHHFGSIVMSALSVHLQSGTPLEEIQSLLKKIKGSLEQEKLNTDRAFSRSQDSCKQMLDDFDSNINLHDKSLESNKNSLKSNKEIFDQTLSSYEELKKELEENISKYEKNSANRELENSEFLKKLREIDDSITTTNEAISLVEHLKAGTSFVQLKGRFDKVKTRLSDSKTGFQSLYKPIISALSQIATKADPEALKEILELLQRLKVSLVDTKVNIEKIEETQKDNWDVLKQDLEEQKKLMFNKKGQLELSIEMLKNIITQTEKKVEYHSLELEKNKDNLKETQQMCDSQVEKYKLEYSEREKEMYILDKLALHFEERFSNLKQYLKERINVN